MDPPAGRGDTGTHVLWPLMGFEADLENDHYQFDHDVHLIRLDPETIERMNEPLDYHPDHDGFEWGLVTNFVGHPKNASFLSPIVRDVVATFLLGLNVVKSTRASAPLEFQALYLPEAGILENLGYHGDLTWPDCHPLTAHYAECFTDDDMAVMEIIWPRVADAFGLTVWNVLGSASYPDPEYHVPTLVDRFREMKDPFARTRLARGLGLFEVGSRSALMPAFVMMCVVLESLYGFEDETYEPLAPGDEMKKGKPEKACMADGLARRVASLLTRKGAAASPTDFRDCYRSVRNVYSARNRIVHGRLLADLIEEDVKRAAFSLARQSLREMLCDEDIFKRFTDMETEDGLEKKAEMNLRLWFLKLEKESLG
jgi:hypothetical protein